MRIPTFILLIIAPILFPTPQTNAETIKIRATATVKDFKDDQGVTGAFAKVGDPVVVVLTYQNSVSNTSSVAESTHYDYGFDARLSSFSISVGDLTWQHDFGVGDLKVRVFNDFEPPAPPHDRVDVSGRGVIEDTFPFAQAGLNYFNLQLIDKDGGMLDSLDLPDDQTKIDVASLKFANGVVQARDPDSKIVWSLQYYVDDVSITSITKPETSLLLSIATLIFIAFVFCAIFLLIVACIAHLIPKKREEVTASNGPPHDGE